MNGNVELLDMCLCNVFVIQLIRAKEVRIDIDRGDHWGKN